MMKQTAVICIKIFGTENHFMKFTVIEIHLLFFKSYFAYPKLLVDINKIIFKNLQPFHLFNFCTNICRKSSGSITLFYFGITEFLSELKFHQIVIHHKAVANIEDTFLIDTETLGFVKFFCRIIPVHVQNYSCGAALSR